jgi:hypothetical protein
MKTDDDDLDNTTTIPSSANPPKNSLYLTLPSAPSSTLLSPANPNIASPTTSMTSSISPLSLRRGSSGNSTFDPFNSPPPANRPHRTTSLDSRRLSLTGEQIHFGQSTKASSEPTLTTEAPPTILLDEPAHLTSIRERESSPTLFDSSPPRHPALSISSSPEQSPEIDADIEAGSSSNLKTLADFPILQNLLQIHLNHRIPPHANKRREANTIKIQQKAVMEGIIAHLPFQDLLFLSKYMHSVQEKRTQNIYFKIIRTECGFYSLFQKEGNTKTWQDLRARVKQQIFSHLVKDTKLRSAQFDFYFNLFNEHRGRVAIGLTNSAVEFKQKFIRQTQTPICI